MEERVHTRRVVSPVLRIRLPLILQTANTMASLPFSFEEQRGSASIDLDVPLILVVVGRNCQG